MDNPSSTMTHNKKPGIAFGPQFFLWTAIAVIVLVLMLFYIRFFDCGSATGRATCTRVLFIGNSFTYVNDLPGTFAKLARSGGHKVETGLSAPGGWTLEQHAYSQVTLNLINESEWDFVVLQEQSQIPASPQSRAQSMYPAARTLVETIKSTGATPLFFVTWAHQHGWSEAGLNDYESMQRQIDLGYQTIARELDVSVAPVGYAWMLEHRQNPQLQLWNPDGYHPDPSGTYLAACVFFAAIFHESPVGLRYHGGLSASLAHELQSMAEQAVLGN